jgi:hypothetical protein
MHRCACLQRVGDMSVGAFVQRCMPGGVATSKAPHPPPYTPTTTTTTCFCHGMHMHIFSLNSHSLCASPPLLQLVNDNQQLRTWNRGLKARCHEMAGREKDLMAAVQQVSPALVACCHKCVWARGRNCKVPCVRWGKGGGENNHASVPLRAPARVRTHSFTCSSMPWPRSH